MVRALPGRL